MKEVACIDFRLLSPDMIRKMSVAKITVPDTHDADGYPIKGGLMDLRLGVVDPGLRCATCGGRIRECPGHFGHIELAKPVVHVGFAKIVYRILCSICRECGRVLLPENKIKKLKERIKTPSDREKFAEHVYQLTEAVKKCPHCGAEQIEIRFDKPHYYYEGKRRLWPDEIRERFEKIPDEHLDVLGLDPKKVRPEWMILTVLPIPPATVRPSITLETGERSEDDLTHKLVDILRLNLRLAENIEANAPRPIIEDQWELVQYHITTYIDNESPGIPVARHRSGRPLKTIAQRLKGKEGRFRHSLAGKRVDFSARTVISPDPKIDIDEVGVPESIAKELTVPERVNEYNIEKLKKLILNGPDKWPGANYVIRSDGRRKKITEENKEEIVSEIEPGYIVERHLMNGDIVLFNRQPSLHRMSIMAHRARIMPYKTFRLNLTVCPPFNADFDGDEMNLHVPQTEEARAEARLLLAVQKHLRSPRFGGPIIGCLHDHVTGCYLLTMKDRKFSKEEAQQLLMAAGVKIDDGKEEWTGKEVFSMLIPSGINLRYKAKVCNKCSECKGENCPYDAYVVIKDGKLIKGVIDDKSIGAFSGILLDEIIRKYGEEEAKKFLNSVTKLAITYLDMHGFTVGIDDEDLPEEALTQLEKHFRKVEEKVMEIIRKYNSGELEPLPGRTLEETVEELIMNALNEGRDEAGKIALKYLKQYIASVIMAKTGARGSLLNITQIAACIGQQAIRGRRISRGYRNRTLPHFKEGDIGAKARGFVYSSYKRGMTPEEFFFHAMGGRESLTDTAMRTPKSGYMQRRLINALQDLKVEYDGTVRDNKGRIIQFEYGEDGIDVTKSDWGKNVNVDKIIDEVLNREK